jgi:hypothetical protein
MAAAPAKRVATIIVMVLALILISVLLAVGGW